MDKRISFFIVLLIFFTTAGCEQLSNKTPGDYAVAAWGHIDEKDLQSAIINLKEGISSFPDNPDLRAEYAKVLNLAGFGEAAELEINRAMEKGFDENEGKLIKAEALLAQEKMIQAISLLTGHEFTQDRQLKKLIYLGKANTLLYQYDIAEKELDQAAVIKNDEIGLLVERARLLAYQGQFDSAVETLTNMKQNNAEAYRLLGDIYYHQNEHEKAIEAFTKSIETGFDNRHSLLGRATSQLKLGDSQAALQDAKKARIPSTFDIPVSYIEGLVFLKDEKYDQALEKFNKIYSKSADYRNIDYLLGLTYFRKGNYQLAQNYLLLYQSRTNKVDTYLDMLLVTALLQNNSPDKAKERLNAILKREPNNQAALELSANLALFEGKGEQVVEALNKLAETGIDPKTLYLKIGVGYLQAGDFDNAEKNIQLAKEAGIDVRNARQVLVMRAIRNRTLIKLCRF